MGLLRISMQNFDKKKYIAKLRHIPKYWARDFLCIPALVFIHFTYFFDGQGGGVRPYAPPHMYATGNYMIISRGVSRSSKGEGGHKFRDVVWACWGWRPPPLPSQGSVCPTRRLSGVARGKGERANAWVQSLIKWKEIFQIFGKYF